MKWLSSILTQIKRKVSFTKKNAKSKEEEIQYFRICKDINSRIQDGRTYYISICSNVGSSWYEKEKKDRSN